MDPRTRQNRTAWEQAAQKYVREYDEILRRSREESSLFPAEVKLLRPLLASSPAVVHPQSGYGLDDIALIAGGARSVVGVDFSTVTVSAAQRRADELGVRCRYLVGLLPGAPLRDGCADLVYTGKGALIWMPDIRRWAVDVTRLLRPAGHLFVYEEHPAAPLWAWHEDAPSIRPNRGYFEASHVNDSFPANGAVQWQHTLGEIVTAVIDAGLEIRHLSEYPEPFWRYGDLDAAAWHGQLPNTFALLARRG